MRPAPAAAKPAAAAVAHDKITMILHPPPKAAVARRVDAVKPMTAKEALKAKHAKQAQAVKREAPEARPIAPIALDPAWVGADASVAAESIEASGAASDALFKAWIDGSNAEAIAAVAATDGLAAPLRKAARRALGVLKARGVSIPEIASDAAPVRSEGEAPVASLVPAEPGNVYISVSQRESGGRFRVADVMINDRRGIMHASGGRIAGKHIRRWKDRVADRFGAPPVEVPIEWARHRVAVARRANEASGQVVPLEYDACRSLLEPAPAVEPPHPLAELEAGVEADDAMGVVPGSDGLHAMPEFRGWLPDRSARDSMLAALAQRLGDKPEPDPARFDTLLSEEMAAATDRFFTPDLREAMVARMRDAAISVRRREGPDAAKRVLALARAIRDAGIITAPPHEVPFLLAFFQKAFAIMLRESQGRISLPRPAPAAAPSPEAAPAVDVPVEGSTTP